MHYRDVIVVNAAGTQESLFVQTAIRLGFNELILLSADKQYVYKSIHSKLRVKTAYFLKTVNEIPIMRKKFDYLFAPATREFFESDIDYIVGLESSKGHDSFHYRNTALNQVHARLCRTHRIALCMDIGALRYASRVEQQRLFGRMKQDATIARKQKVDVYCYSFAQSPQEMIPPESLHATGRILGLKTFK